MKIKKTTKETADGILADMEAMDEQTPLATGMDKKGLLSSGSSLLNKACSGSIRGAFLKGHYYILVGDSSSGKTFLSMTCFAEAEKNRYFREHRLIYDNVEDGCLPDMNRLFNEATAKRVEPPACDKKGNPEYSFTIEDFYINMDNAISKGKPFIYVLDSMDSLSSDYELNKFQEAKDAREKGKDVAGSYGDGKAKKNSENIRRICKGLRDTGSILIILSQTRDNLGFGFETKSRAGGRALKFYATLEIWSSVAGVIKKTVMGKERKIGIHSLLQIKKNRLTGLLNEVTVDIYPSYGIDDIGSCVDYLIGEGAWEKEKAGVTVPEWGFSGKRESLIAFIEKESKEAELLTMVSKCWEEIDEKSSLKRQKKY